MSEPAWFQNLEREDSEFVYALTEERSRRKAWPTGPVLDVEYTPCPSCGCLYYWADERWCPDCDWGKKSA